MKFRIPLAKPEITEADREAVMEVLRTPYLSSGPKVQEFEEAICDYTASKYAVAVNSGTSALQIAVRALRLEAGSEVILPSFAFSALLNVILQEDLTPKFVDIDPETYNTTPEMVAAAVTEKTRLVIAVHTFGVPVDVQSIRDVLDDGASRTGRAFDCLASLGRSGQAPRQRIHLIEDACEALGAQMGTRKTGTLGEAGLFAFYPNKQITTAEGGMLVTSDEPLATQARILRNQGRGAALNWQDHNEIGFSYRLSDINCALGISQLKRIDDVIERRQRLAEAYDRNLAGIHEIVRPRLTSGVGRISWFVYPMRLADHFTRNNRDRICDSLASKGVGTGKYFAPLHRQPVLQRLNPQVAPLPNTEFVADRIICLPFFNEITTGEIAEVSSTLKDAIQSCCRKT
jgi:perosamine synthetase